MSEEEKNLVERDYEGEIRAKIMMEINKRFNEMETRIISKIAAVDSELKYLRAKLYNEHNPGWREYLINQKKEYLKNAQKDQERDQSQITSYQNPLDTNYRNLTLNQIDHYKDEIAKLQNCIKCREEQIKKLTKEIEKISKEQRYW